MWLKLRIFFFFFFFFFAFPRSLFCEQSCTKRRLDSHDVHPISPNSSANVMYSGKEQPVYPGRWVSGLDVHLHTQAEIRARMGDSWQGAKLFAFAFFSFRLLWLYDFVKFPILFFLRFWLQENSTCNLATFLGKMSIQNIKTVKPVVC